MIQLTIKLIQQGKKSKEVETTLSGNVTLDMMKKLWEAEQTLNSLPGANLRVHISVDENGHDKLT